MADDRPLPTPGIRRLLDAGHEAAAGMGVGHGALQLGLGADLRMGYGELRYAHRLAEELSVFAATQAGWLWGESRPYGAIGAGLQYKW